MATAAGAWNDIVRKAPAMVAATLRVGKVFLMRFIYSVPFWIRLRKRRSLRASDTFRTGMSPRGRSRWRRLSG